jgi:hypothetical protein
MKSDFERGQIVCAHSAGASATVSIVMSSYTNYGKTTSAKRNSRQKSVLTERDCHTLRRTVSKNHITTAAQVTAELNI